MLILSRCACNRRQTSPCQDLHLVFSSKGEGCIDDIPTPTLTFANVNDIYYSFQWMLLTSLPPLCANVTDIDSLHSPIWQYLACCGHWTKSLNRLVKPLTASLNRHVEPLTASHVVVNKSKTSYEGINHDNHVLQIMWYHMFTRLLHFYIHVTRTKAQGHKGIKASWLILTS